MALTFEQRESRRRWAQNHPDKVKEANRRWRKANVAKVRRQARVRMKRWRDAIRAAEQRNGVVGEPIIERRERFRALFRLLFK